MGEERHHFSSDFGGLPICEGRMVAAYDYRAKIYLSGHGNSARWMEIPFGDPRKAVVPQWRINPNALPSKVGDQPLRFRIGLGDVANPRNERSLTATVIPAGIVSAHTVPTIEFTSDFEWAFLPWLAAANSFVIDFLVRSRLSSPHLTFTVMDSLPFPRLRLDDERVHRLSPLVLRLMCTGPEMTPFWNKMAVHGWTAPVPEGTVPASALVDMSARSDAKAEIDAVVAKLLYGIDREELSFIIDTFSVLRRREEKANNGEFRTKRLVLDCYDKV
jgi:hypothetical protein